MIYFILFKKIKIEFFFFFGVPNHLFTVVRKRLSELIPKREK